MSNAVRSLGTKDGRRASPCLNSLSKEMLGSKKRNYALNILQLMMKSKQMRCHITAKMREAMCTANLVSDIFLPLQFQPFWLRHIRLRNPPPR